MAGAPLSVATVQLSLAVGSTTTNGRCAGIALVTFKLPYSSPESSKHRPKVPLAGAWYFDPIIERHHLPAQCYALPNVLVGP
ncbi:hypothetical protein C2E23DRAFT_604216 [Lenzites betulinus]|nr:hypothetical protein C2E23DRAFT_604216 [Lenzites betulinus]